MSPKGVQYRINNTSKWGMLTLALMFDAIQLITPGIMDTFVIAMAALIFGMLFLEKGALTQSGTGAIKLFRWLIPLAEIFISHLPGITLMIWIQIKISRFYDMALPDQIHQFVRQKRLMVVSHQKKQLKKYAYGKGKRGARTLKRKMGIKDTPRTDRVQRRLDTKKVV